MAKPLAINDADFEAEVLEADVPVLVDFWAEWCGPCKALAPDLDELAEEYDGRIKIVKIDTEENLDVMIKYGVRGLPTLLVFKGGEQVELISGAPRKKELKASLEKALG